MDERNQQIIMSGACLNVGYDLGSSLTKGPDGEPAVCFQCGDDSCALQGAVAYVWGRVFLLRTRSMGWLIADDEVRFSTGLDSILIVWNGECKTISLHWPMRLPSVLETTVLDLIEKFRPERLPPECRRRRRPGPKSRTSASGSGLPLPLFDIGE